MKESNMRIRVPVLTLATRAWNALSTRPGFAATIVLTCASALVAFGAVPRGAQGRQEADSVGEWRDAYGDVRGTRYSPLDLITKANIGDLQVAWRTPVPDRALQESNTSLRAGTVRGHAAHD